MPSKIRTRAVVAAGLCAALTLTGASVAIAEESVTSAQQVQTGEVTASTGKFMIGDKGYDTLKAAVDAVTSDTATTITLTGDVSGDGVQVPGNKNIVFDLAGHTYTVDGETVGSTGTETNGFHLLKDSTITFKNGTVVSDKALILIQNYSNLTLDGVTVKGGANTQYALSNNNGATVIKNGSNILAGQGKGQVAFDVCGFSSYAGASVTVEKGAGKIEGVIELSNSGQHELSLSILGGDLSKATLKAATGAEAVRVTKAAEVKIAAPEGYQWVANTLVKPTENVKVAAVTAGGAVSMHTAVSEALNAEDVSKVMLLDDVTEDVSIAFGKTVTLDLAGHTLTNQSGDTVTVAMGGNLTVVDSGTGGAIDNKTNGRAAVFNNGCAVLEGGAYDRTAETGESPEVSKGNSWYTICNHGEMTIKAGASVKNKGSFSSMIENGYQSYGSNNQRTGYIEGANAANPILTIEGGSFDGGLNAVKNDDGGKLAIKGGTFTNSTQATLLNWNEAAISGGTFKATSSAKACVLNGASKVASSEYDKGDLKISGGNFSVDGGAACIVNNITGTAPVVTGGTFSSDPSAFVPASGYIVSQSGGAWAVSKYVPPVTPPTPSDKTEVEHGEDGSTTTTVTKPDGSQTITHETASGTESVVKKDEDGNVISTQVAISGKDADTGKVELPIEGAKPAADAESALDIKIDVPASVTAEKPVRVTVPVGGDEPGYGVVLFTVDAGGSETLLSKSAVDKDGNLVFEVTGDVSIKIVDNAKVMPDVKDSDWFAGDVVDFATSRGIVNGVLMEDGTREFQGNGGTTRAMFVGMLHNLELAPKASTGDSLGDVLDSDWFAGAAAWALEAGVLEGVDTGSGREFRGGDPVTREQVAVFLMRYAEKLGLNVSGRAEIEFVDGSETSEWAREAMSWAVSEGLFTGNAATGELSPTSGATRAEVATVLMRFINQVLFA